MAHHMTTGRALKTRTWPRPGGLGACLRVALFTFACALLASAPALAQSGAGGRPITTVEIQGLKLLSEETLLFYLGLKPGEVLDEEVLDQRIKELWSRQLLDDIAVEAVPDGAGVHIIVRVEERPILRSVEYVGLKRLGRTDIDDRVNREHVDLKENAPIDRGQIERLRALLEEMYREKGYRFAQIDVRLEELERGEVRATVTVDEGDRVRIGDIDFEGNDVFGDLRLRWVMKNTKESGPINRVLKKDIYNPASLEEDLVKLRELYRSAGYKNALVGDPRIDVRTDGEKRRLALIIPIDEGERWRFGKVSIEGNEQFTEEGLLSLFELREGSWLRTDVIDEAIEKIKQAYDNSGYIFSKVEPELVEREGYVADLVVKISENEQFRIARIEFQGNTSTRDKVLRRELRVQEGLFINLGGVKNSVYKVNQLSYFKLDEADPVGFDADNEAKTVNLTFKGNEDNRTELQFGAGYSDFQGFFGQLAFRTFNFLGRGETVGVSLESGTQRDLFDVSYFVPWFLDKPQSIGIQGFRQQLEFRLGSDLFIRKSIGGVLTYGRSLGLFQNLSLSYTRSFLQDQVIGRNDAGDRVTLQDLDIDNSSLRPSWVYNSVDNRFEPTRGQRLRASVEYAGGLLGGDNYFIRPELGYSLFLPVSGYPLRTVFGLNVEAGWIEPFGSFTTPEGVQVDRGLSPLERYFLGGENSVRGHRFRSIFVRDSQGNPVPDPSILSVGLGGDQYFQINVEYHFLLGGPFRMILFVDGGNVYGEFREAVLDADGNQQIRFVNQSIDLSTLRWTAGAELRLLVPVFGAPLRFIYAVNLDEQVGDEFDTFRFSIGAAF